MRTLFKTYLFLLFIFIYGCSSTTDVTKNVVDTLPELREKIQKRFDDSTFSHAHWGALIKSLKTGKVWYEQNSDKMFMPASNEKIITTAAALTKLGPDAHFRTTISIDGFIKDSVIVGDLIVKGEGDPTFYLRFFDDPREVFFSWAKTLDSLGIKRIEGNIIGNDNLFDDVHLGSGWSYDYLDSWYAAEVGALQFNENYIDLKIYPPRIKGENPLIIPNVESEYFNINNLLEATDTGKTNFSVHRDFGTNEIVVEGKVKIGDRIYTASPSITNPTLFYVTVMKEAFEEYGIVIDGYALDIDDIPPTRELRPYQQLITYNSPPLKDILKELIKVSQNLYAETMTRLLGYRFYGEGSFKNGKKVVEEVLESFGIEKGSYSYADGSGLTRYNFVSPDQLVTILSKMYNGQYKNIWIDLFPVAGVDGTLRNRMKGTSAEGNVKAKTGTISNVRGLSGYVTTGDGEELVFSFLVNGHLLTSRDTEKITDSVLEMIADFKRVSL